ncbi:alanine dehydrogenase [Candidatus Nitronereus thalassa]|uniref:Alanine dehydrogenase n=1 Tax=Candidatus Nitronereus thalassa TaxID=3020898 RepID=A0ABU3K4D6_9BACT|nr:alanine dehydrogenase [Candidatus Nitronereus thalassa]MDT7041233.1 alanine dehydrogenase [Candidatus Nitronereus thalassa]
MIIGILKEIKDHEFRVALTPEGVGDLVQHGHQVWIELNAGAGSGFSDDDYLRVGAQLAASKEEVFQKAKLILKVKEPLLHEVPLFQSHHTLFTYLHLAASKDLTQALMDSGMTALAYETTEDRAGRLPMLLPMSQIAGRMSIQIGAHYLERTSGGRGLLLGGVPGVKAAHVVIIGAGGVGSSAAQIAVGMGARVTVFSVDIHQLVRLEERFGGGITTLVPNRLVIEKTIEDADLLIGAAMIKGARAPQLVSRDMVASMKPGSVIVDVAIDQGGCVETIRPTTHSEPTYEVEGVLHYGVTNIPGIVPVTSTHALTNATLPFIVRLADAGIERAISDDPWLAKGVNIKDGQVTYQAVAEAHGFRHVPIVV